MGTSTVGIPTRSPEANYAQLMAGLLPGLKLGQAGGGGTWYCPFSEGMARGAGFVSSGTLTWANTSKGGILLAQTSVTAGGNVGVLSGSGTQIVVCVGNAKAEQWAYVMRARIPSTDANFNLFMGAMEPTRATHNGLKIVGTGTNTATLNLEANGNLTATSWVFDPNAEHEFMVTYDTVTMTAYVDGTPVGSAANSANVNAVACALGWQLYNGGAAVNEQAQVMRCGGAFGAP